MASPGAVRLTYDAYEGGFRVTTEYISPVELSAEQLDRLEQETAGQWSDGIGEECFYELSDRLGVSISLSLPDHVEQIEAGKTTGKTGTGLAKAAREGDMASLREHLDAGADLEARLQRYTPLHLAVLYGQVEAALELLQRGADIHARNPQGDDPLLLAAMSNAVTDANAVKIAVALLERGAPVHGPWGAAASNVGEYTPLDMAESREKTELAVVLRQFGATGSSG